MLHISAAPAMLGKGNICEEKNKCYSTALTLICIVNTERTGQDFHHLLYILASDLLG